MKTENQKEERGRSKTVSKQIAFVARDIDLIRRIEEYQQENKLLYFVEAVRQLCEKGLKFNEVQK